MNNISTFFLTGIFLLPQFIYAQLPANQPEQDCINALPICQNIFVQTNSYQGTGLSPAEINPLTSCLGAGEVNSTWYTFTAQTAGDISFTITPIAPFDDYDWAVFNLTNANCSDILTNTTLEVSCNYSGTPGATGPNGGPGGFSPFNPVIPVGAGETYVINISNFSGSTSGYTIDFSASTALIIDTVSAELQIPTTACSSDSIYFSFDEEVVCSSVDISDFTLTGAGGPYTITQVIGASCQLGGLYEDKFIILTTPSIPKQGSFTLSVVDTILDQCGNVAVFNAKSFPGSVTDSMIFPISCGSYTSPSGNHIWTTSGTYMDTIPNVQGCDSLLFINLTINDSSVSVINPIVCGSFTVPSGDTTYMISGTYFDMIPNSVGCDSIITINLTVNENTSSVIDPITCDSFTVPSGDTTYVISGTYSDTIPNLAGCDSIITINLTINENTSSVINPMVCTSSYTVPSGDETYTTSGTYSDTIPNLAGCDSIITINLTITSINASISQNEDTLTANVADATYQWLDCSDQFSVIPGADGQNYILSSSGVYAVEITQNGCIDTSACFNAIKSGIEQNSFGNLLSVFPNPTTGQFTIDLGKVYGEISVSINNLQGQLVLNQNFGRTDKLSLNIPGAPGLYFLEIRSANGENAILKIIKE